MMTNGSNQLQSKEQAMMSLCATVVDVRVKSVGAVKHLRWIFRYVLLEGGQLLAVLVVKPFHLEVQVHIICTFTQAVLLVL